MMALWASGHRARDERRRAAVLLSQSMSPWRSAAMKPSRRRAVASSSSRRAMPAAASPSARASALIRDSIDAAAAVLSEIEIGIGGRGRKAPDVIGEQRTKGGPRLDPLVPGLGIGILLPGHIAEIVDRGEMRCRRKIGGAQLSPG